MKYYLGIDNGGTSTKAAVFDENGVQLSVASRATEAVYPRPGFVEIDMEEMWRANCEVIRNALKKSGISPDRIRAAAICGHGKGLYLWGKNGQPVRHGIMSNDSRAYAYPAQWRESGQEAEAFKYTCQNIMACQPIPLLAWLQDNEPDSLKRTQYIFSCKDYVRFRLTGEAYAERTDYSGSGLLNLHTGEYDEKILKIFGLKMINDALPPLRNAADICGYVTEQAAEQTGLMAGTPVAGGMFDIDACALSAAAADREHVCMVAGTWSINEFILPYPITDGRVQMNSMFCVPGYYLIEESSPTSAGNLSWYLNNLEEKCDGIYDSLNQLAGSVKAEEFSPLFLPFIIAGNVNPNARGTFIGINSYHTKAHIIRSIYEGVAFSHRWHYERLRTCMEKEPASIRLAGGAARSPVWTQIFADVMKLPVETSAVEETGALGCAIAASVAVGDNRDFAEAISQMTRLSEPVMPRNENLKIYDEKYGMYIRTIEALDSIWDELKTFAEKSV